MKNCQIGMYEKAIPEEYSIQQMLEFGKEAGYDFFEISIDRTDKRINRIFDISFIRSLKHSIHDAGFSIGSMCLSALGTYTLGSPDPETEKRAKEIFYHAVSFAEELGVRIVQIPACDVPKNGDHTKETDRRFIHNLHMLIEYAASHSVIIGLENMEDMYMDNVEKNMRLISEIHSPYFLLYSDGGNITSAAKKYGYDIKQDMMRGKGQYCAFHLKETQPNRYGGLFYGNGHVNFEEMIDIAWNNLEIRRYVLEYWYTGNPEWKNDLVKARQMCEEWIRNAQIKGTN